ncbi:MAG: DNA polymerase III subunit epsilon [Holosporales bacterium]|jgi:DNA polymerase-3 subunit epsilon|nr:DNA polymerase III subunit epsilon [Holosporales bacterium]
MREIALDTETTGLSTADGDRITEIGCVEIIDKKITNNTYHVYINPEREVSREATDISGLTFDFLKQFRTFKDEYQGFLDFISDSRLVIHNAPFDIGFLNYELSLVGANPIDPENVVDTLVMAKAKYPGSPATLDALCRKFSVNNSMRLKHGALIDAELLAEVYINMSVELRQNALFANRKCSTSGEQSRRAYSIPDRVFTVPEDELAAHRESLKKITNPIWDML